MNELETIACISRVVLFGDKRAFEQIVRAYEQPLRQFLLQQTGGDSDLTDDLAQETFIRAWQQLTTFRHAAQFRTWLFSIAYHLYMDDCRRRQAHPMVDIALLQLENDCDTQHANDSPLIDDSEADPSSVEEWVHRALDRIAEPARTVLRLSLMMEMSGKEISRITGLSETNIRQIIFRYRPKLKQILLDIRKTL